MADNLDILDGSKAARKLATKDLGSGIHLPKHLLADATGAPVSPATQATLAAVLAALQAMAPASGHAAVTPHDTNALAAGVRSLYIGTGGDLVVTVDGDDVTYTVTDGAVLTVRATHVKATGTTADDIVAWY